MCDLMSLSLFYSDQELQLKDRLFEVKLFLSNYFPTFSSLEKTNRSTKNIKITFKEND